MDAEERKFWNCYSDDEAYAQGLVPIFEWQLESGSYAVSYDEPGLWPNDVAKTVKFDEATKRLRVSNGPLSYNMCWVNVSNYFKELLEHFMDSHLDRGLVNCLGRFPGWLEHFVSVRSDVYWSVFQRYVEQCREEVQSKTGR